MPAGCSLADSSPPEKFLKFPTVNLYHVVVTYINCSTEIKAMSDYVYTSSDAGKIIHSTPGNKKDFSII